MFGEEGWTVLSQVGVDDQKQDTCVEELSVENSVGDRSKLLTDGIFTDPGNEGNDGRLQDDIYCNNDKSNTGTKDFRHGLI